MAPLQACGDSNGPIFRAKEVLGRAFHDYNLMVYAQPGDRRRAPAVAHLYGALVWDCIVRGEAYVNDDFTGITAWLAPGTDIPNFWQQVQAGMLRMPLGFGLRGFRRLIDYDEVGRRMHHQYAQAALVSGRRRGGTEPARGRHRQQHDAPILAQADTQGVPCWLDTHQDQNVRLDQCHGFRIAERTVPRGHEIPVYGMIRPPRSTS